MNIPSPEDKSEGVTTLHCDLLPDQVALFGEMNALCDIRTQMITVDFVNIKE